MRRVAFFLNPLLIARRNRQAIVDRCAKVLRDEGCEIEMQPTLSAYSAGEQAREAIEKGVDTIFVCGGDGTFFQVIQGTAGSDAALGLVPFGTGNVLAQNLQVPRDPLVAFEMQRRAKAVTVPLGEVICRAAGHASERSWYFTIAAGVGIHAALMNLSSAGSGKRMIGRAAYYAGGVRLLVQHPIQQFDAEVTGVNGEVTKFRACELLAVRVPAINRWRPGGDLSSSRLRLAAVPQTSRLGLSHAMFHAVITRKNRSTEGRGLPYPRYEDVSQVVCMRSEGHSYQVPILVQADGEVIGVERATFRMAQKGLRLLWPGGEKA